MLRPQAEASPERLGLLRRSTILTEKRHRTAGT